MSLRIPVVHMALCNGVPDQLPPPTDDYDALNTATSIWRASTRIVLQTPGRLPHYIPGSLSGPNLDCVTAGGSHASQEGLNPLYPTRESVLLFCKTGNNAAARVIFRHTVRIVAYTARVKLLDMSLSNPSSHMAHPYHANSDQ